MIHQKLNEALQKDFQEKLEELYSIGFSCGQTGFLNFETIKAALAVHECQSGNNEICLDEILKGFRDGVNAPPARQYG